MLFYTGLRISELQALLWKYVDFEKTNNSRQKLVNKTRDDWYLSLPITNISYKINGCELSNFLPNKIKMMLNQFFICLS